MSPPPPPSSYLTDNYILEEACRNLNGASLPLAKKLIQLFSHETTTATSPFTKEDDNDERRSSIIASAFLSRLFNGISTHNSNSPITKKSVVSPDDTVANNPPSNYQNDVVRQPLIVPREKIKDKKGREHGIGNEPLLEDAYGSSSTSTTESLQRPSPRHVSKSSQIVPQGLPGWATDLASVLSLPSLRLSSTLTTSHILKKCLTIFYTTKNLSTIHSLLPPQAPPSKDKIQRYLRTLLESTIDECENVRHAREILKECYTRCHIEEGSSVRLLVESLHCVSFLMHRWEQDHTTVDDAARMTQSYAACLGFVLEGEYSKSNKRQKTNDDNEKRIKEKDAIDALRMMPTGGGSPTKENDLGVIASLGGMSMDGLRREMERVAYFLRRLGEGGDGGRSECWRAALGGETVESSFIVVTNDNGKRDFSDDKDIISEMAAIWASPSARLDNSKKLMATYRRVLDRACSYLNNCKCEDNKMSLVAAVSINEERLINDSGGGGGIMKRLASLPAPPGTSYACSIETPRPTSLAPPQSPLPSSSSHPYPPQSTPVTQRPTIRGPFTPQNNNLASPISHFSPLLEIRTPPPHNNHVPHPHYQYSNVVTRTNTPPPFLSSPLSMYGDSLPTPSPFHSNKTHPHNPNNTNTPSSSNSRSDWDWLHRLHSDTTLLTPSWRLNQYFKSSSPPRCSSSLFNTTILPLLTTLFRNLDRGLGGNTTSSNISFTPAGELIFSCDTSTHAANNRRWILTSTLSLYYTSLETILSIESERLKTISHGGLLSNDSFLKSLCGVCAEVVMAGFGFGELGFLDVLKIMEIQACSFLKVTECFVRALCSMGRRGDTRSSSSRNGVPMGLPVVFRKHLKRCDEEILESLVWVKEGMEGSLMVALGVLRGLQGERNISFSWPPMCLLPSRDEQNMIGEDSDNENPNYVHDNENPSVVSNSQSPRSTIPHTTANDEQQLRQHHIAVSFVLRKLLTLTSRKINDLSQHLNLSSPVMGRVWVAWRYFLTHYIELLYDRHVDQLLLCTMYGVCKIIKVDPEVSFRRIIDAYHDLSDHRDDTTNDYIIRNVRLDTPPDSPPTYGNVIAFYNQVYVPRMKKHLLKNQHFLEHAQKEARQTIRTVEDAARIADNAAAQSSSTPSLVTDTDTSRFSTSMLTSLMSMTPVNVHGNVYVSTTGPGRDCYSTSINVVETTRNRNNDRLPKLTMRTNSSGTGFSLSPRRRSLYNFGGKSAKGDLDRINRTVREAAMTAAAAPPVAGFLGDNMKNKGVRGGDQKKRRKKESSSSSYSFAKKKIEEV